MVQKKLLVASIFIAAISGVAFIPFIARNVDFAAMAAISLILFFNAFLGAFDVLKPVLIKDFSRQEFDFARIPIRKYLKIVVLFGLAAVIFLQAARALFFAHLMSRGEGVFVSLAFVCYFFSTLFWSVLDAKNQVGTAQLSRSILISLLYFLFFCFSWFNAELIWYAAGFFLVHALILLVFVVLTRDAITWRPSGVLAGQMGEILSTAQLNASKIAIDFSDRLLLAKFLPAAAFSAYAGLYEITSKINILPQYYNAYIYPRLCRNFALRPIAGEYDFARKHFAIAAINFFAIVFVGLLSSPFFDVLVSLYLGSKYAGNSEILGVLLASAAVYSLAFYAQSFFRSVGRFSELSRAYFRSMVLGLVSMPFFLWGLGVEGLIFSVILLKSPGIGVFAAAVGEVYGRSVKQLGGLLVSSSVAALIGVVGSGRNIAIYVGLLLALVYFFGATTRKHSEGAF